MKLQLCNLLKYSNYIFYWVVWHVINHNFAQVIVKIKICQRCFWIIPSASFFQPTWISTVTFNLRLLASYFHLLITDLCKTSIMGVYGWSKLLACDNTQDMSYYIHYIYNTHAVSDYVLILHNTKFGTLRELPALIFRNLVHFKQIYVYIVMQSKKTRRFFLIKNLFFF